MSFLTGLYLAGLAAISLPIIFHLTRRTPRGRIAFGSLMFLMPSPPRLTRRNRLDDLLLLLLRATALALLALAFSRPFFREVFEIDLGLNLGRRTVILIDTSASMRRADLWQRSKEKMEEILDDLRPADQVAIFSFDRTSNPLITFEQWLSVPPQSRSDLVRQRLRGLSPGWSATHLGSALVKMIEVLENARSREEENPNLGPERIILVTDLQQGSRLEPLDAFDWPKEITLSVHQVEPENPTNAGLQFLAETGNDEKNSDDDSQAVLRVRISNSADATRDLFRIRWASDDQDSTEDLQAARDSKPPVESEGIEVYVPPGRSRVVRLPEVSLGSHRLLLDGDDHDFDNVAYRVPPRTEQVTVLYLGSDSPADPQQLRYYLERALSGHARRQVRILAPEPDEPLWTFETPFPRLAIVTESFEEGRIALLRKSLVAGGTVLVVLKDPSVAEILSRLLGTEGIATSESTVTDYAMLMEIDFRHPLFEEFADPRFSDFTKIHFEKHRRVDLESFSDARVLARFDDGDPALIDIPYQGGSVLLLTAGWHPEDSDLALSSKFVPLMNAILERSLGYDNRVVSYRVGDPIELPKPHAERSPFWVHKPDGTKELFEMKVAGSSQPVFTRTMMPGVYALFSDPETSAAYSFAVNLAPEESKTATMPIEELERLGIRLTDQEPELTKQEEIERRRQMHSVELESRQKLWRWLIVAVLAVLVLETWLAGRATRMTTTGGLSASDHQKDR